MPRIAVDRIEGDRVLVEVDGILYEISQAEAPAQVAEGSTWETDAWPSTSPWRATAAGSEAPDLLSELRSRTPQKGDIDL